MEGVGAGGGRVVGGGAGGGRVEDARGRPTASLGGEATAVRLAVGLGGSGCTEEAAYG